MLVSQPLEVVCSSNRQLNIHNSSWLSQES